MSKFDKLFEARESGEREKPRAAEQKTGPKKESVKLPQQPSGSATTRLDRELEQPKNHKPRGRPKAKRSDPNFIGFTTYIRKDTHLNVKIALLREGGGRELSELVEELLSKWVENK